MIEAVTMPRWGMAMEEGTVIGWHVAVGGRVEPGDEILDVESTKASSAVEARTSGVIRRQLAQAGSILPVGSLLGVIAAADVLEDEIQDFISRFAQTETEAGAEPTSGPVHVLAGSRRINCLSEGEGTPVVLLHGFGGSIESWSLTQSALAARHRTIAIDLPGHGESDESLEKGDIEELAGVILPVLDALGVEAAHVVGHSLGGAVAIAAAVLDPARVRSLTLIAPVGFGPEIDAKYIEGFLLAKRRRDLRPHVERLFADAKQVSERMLEDLLRMKRVGGVQRALRQIADHLFPAGRQHVPGLREGYLGLAMPRLLLWGDQDQIIAPAQGDALGAVRIRAAGHMPQIERASEINRLILAHLAASEAGQ
jgi:pyruvate dehydrogenase E2 component (dihydrolipoamide acetyltransferase)